MIASMSPNIYNIGSHSLTYLQGITIDTAPPPPWHNAISLKTSRLTTYFLSPVSRLLPVDASSLTSAIRL